LYNLHSVYSDERHADCSAENGDIDDGSYKNVNDNGFPDAKSNEIDDDDDDNC